MFGNYISMTNQNTVSNYNFTSSGRSSDPGSMLEPDLWFSAKWDGGPSAAGRPNTLKLY